MYPVATDLFSTLEVLVRNNVGPIVIVEEAPEYPGELIFQPADTVQEFYHAYKDWVSRYCVLNQLFNLDSFVAKLKEDGHTIVFAPNTAEILRNIERWKKPLHVEGYDLYPFQQFGLNRALERRGFFFNWSAGAGKSFCSAAAAKKLFAQGEIDLVLAFTPSKLKENLRRFFEQAGLDAVVNDGTKDKRQRVYRENHQVFVANYEKSWWDLAELTPMVERNQVLFIFDEVHKIVTDGTQNKSRKALDSLIKISPRPRVWPMSASVVNGNPLKYRDVFSIGSSSRSNPLGPKTAFISQYARSVKTYDVKTRTGGTFKVTDYDWDLSKLQDVRHRVADRTQAVRKTDPGVREQFKGLQTVLVPVQMSKEERALADEITERAREARDRGEGLMPYYRLLRYSCNTPRAVVRSEDPVGQQLAADYPELVDHHYCTKLEMLNEQLESIREAGDKVLCFTHWTNLTLLLIERDIKVPHVVHYGSGQTDRESQQAQDKFKADPDITCFLTSDAGSHGLNMQCARYVIQYEPLYSYDDSMQRASRIDRSDSHLDALTNYCYVTEDSVEERVWGIQQQRKAISAAIQGTSEVLSYSPISEAENLDFLIFGEEAG